MTSIGTRVLSSLQAVRGATSWLHPGRAGHDGAQPVPAKEYRTDLQGLRAVAVLLVVLDHAGVGFAKGGFVGVDVFFVLSGFLITGLLLGGAGKRGYVSLVDFYTRRARRILPAAVLTLVVTTIAAEQLLNYVRAKQVAWDSFWASLFAANIRFAHQGTDYFAQGQPPSSVLHYWSLAVEEQFYLVWPALLSLALYGAILGGRSGARRRLARKTPISKWALRRLLIVIVLATAASLAWSIHDTDVVPAAAYFSPFTRAWELGLGAALAVATLKVRRLPAALQDVAGWVGVIAIGVAAVTFSDTTPFPGYAALLPTAGAALVIGAGTGREQLRFGVGRLLAVAPMRYVGDRSYAFYLWHWPVLTIAVLHQGHELEVGVKLLLLLGAFLLSIVSYRFFENPIRRARWKTPASAMLVPVSVATVVAVTLLTLSSINAKVVRLEGANAAVAAPAATKLARAPRVAEGPPLAGVIAAVKAARRGARLPAGLTPPASQLLKEAYQFPAGCVPTTDSQATSDICHLGDESAGKSILLFGDSHAQMWMPTILAMASADGWTVIPIVKSGCVPSSWMGKGYPGTPGAKLTACHAWYQWAVQQAKAAQSDVVLITGCCSDAAGSTATATKAVYASLAAALKGSAKNVIVVADDDGVDKQPVDCLLAPHATMKTCTTTATDARYAFNDELAKLAKVRRFGLLKTRGWFCYERQCPMVVGHTIVYRDTGHITQAYALQLAAPFRAAFRRCIFDSCPS